MRPLKRLTFFEVIAGLGSIGFLLGWVWPGGFVGAALLGLLALFLASAAYLVWSLFKL